MKPSSKHQEQSDFLPRQVDTPSNGPITPWYCWFPYFYMPMDYSMIHMQLYYIQYPLIYPNYAYKNWLFLATIWSNGILIAAKQMRKAQSKIQSIYIRSSVFQACLTLRSKDHNGCATRSRRNNKWRLYQQDRRP